MKKVLKISGKILVLLIGLFVLAMIIVPVVFKGKLTDVARTELNKSVNAHVYFSDLKLSLIRSFPNLSIGLEDFSISGKEPFEGDTLVHFRAFRVAVNPFGLIGKKGIVISKVLLDRPVIHALVLKDGTANWDIAAAEPTDTLVLAEDTTASGMPQIKVQLKEFRIRDASVTYKDRQGDMAASLDDLNFLLRGHWTGSAGSLFTETTIGAVNVVTGRIPYVKDATFRFMANLGADPGAGTYTFKDNELALNDLLLAFGGKVKMSGDTIHTDITFKTRETSFKSLLSMVPAIYKHDFNDLKTTGKLALYGRIGGQYLAADSTYPSATLHLKVSDASFAYPGLPGSVNDVNIDVTAHADGTDPDLSTVDVNRFALKLGQNPFRAEFHLRHPVSDPAIKGMIKGKIDLATLTEAVPLDSTELSGLITADMHLGGTMSMIEQEKYEDFTADGSVKVQHIVVATPLMKDKVEIPSGSMFFSPRYVDMQQLKIIIGPSDMGFSGKLEQFIPYVFADGTVKGKLDFISHNLDVNRLMPETTGRDTVTETDTIPSELSVLEVPEHVDVVLSAHIQRIKYSHLDMQNVAGRILVKDRKVILDNIQMRAMDGSLHVNGEYSTQKPEEPRVSMEVEAKDISVPRAYKSLMTVRKLVPFTRGLQGTVSSKFTYSGLLDQQMMPVLKTVNADGKLQSSGITVVSAGVFDKIKKLLRLNPQYTNEFKDLNLSFHVKNGMLRVDPFHTKAGDIDMTISGEQGLDQSVRYVYKMKVPRKVLGNKANDLISGLYGKAAQQGLQLKESDVIPVKALITGTVTHPKVSLNLAGQTKSVVNEAKEAVKRKVEEEVHKQVEQTMEKADRLLAEAKKKYEEALRFAKEERDIAYQKADTLEKKASGSLVQKLKIKAQAEALRKGADAAYKQAVKTAGKQYEKAKAKAEEIRRH